MKLFRLNRTRRLNFRCHGSTPRNEYIAPRRLGRVIPSFCVLVGFISGYAMGILEPEGYRKLIEMTDFEYWMSSLDQKNDSENHQQSGSEEDGDVDWRMEIFQKYADVRENGEIRGITPVGFIKLLLGPQFQVPSWVARPRDTDGTLCVDKKIANSTLAKIISLADQDGDGVISFEEMIFFQTLLSSTPHQFKIAFKMMDESGDGEISFEEFQKIISLNFGNHPFPHQSNLLKEFFGEDLQGSLYFNEFDKFISDLRSELLRLEFDQHDYEDCGEISVESFAFLITHSAQFNSLKPDFFRKKLNLLKTNGFFRPSGKIGFETFLLFHQMAQNFEDIGFAIKLSYNFGKSIDRKILSHCLKNIAEVNVDEKAIDVLFAIFDQDQNGTLELEEFLKVMNEFCDSQSKFLSGAFMKKF